MVSIVSQVLPLQNSASTGISTPSSGSYKIKRLPAVKAQVGLSRATIYAHIKQGSFPRPIRLGGNSVGWISSEVDSWLDERVMLRDQVPLHN